MCVVICVYVYVCVAETVCVWVYEFVCMYLCVCVCAIACVCVRAFERACTHTRAYECMRVRACALVLHACVRAYVRVSCICMCVCVCVRERERECVRLKCVHVHVYVDDMMPCIAHKHNTSNPAVVMRFHPYKRANKRNCQPCFQGGKNTDKARPTQKAPRMQCGDRKKIFPPLLFPTISKDRLRTDTFELSARCRQSTT